MKKYHTDLAFLDLLFNTLLCFAALFALAFILISPAENDKNMESNAEFIITVTWPNKFNDDVDTYVEDPAGNLVAFMRREEGLMHLDRDDLGRSNDIVHTDYGPIEYNDNREIVTLRGFIKGEYIVNVHMYYKRSEGITPVTIQIDKLNPFSTVAIKTVMLPANGDEVTAFRFVLDKNGEVKEVNSLPKTLIRPGGTNL